MLPDQALSEVPSCLPGVAEVAGEVLAEVAPGPPEELAADSKINSHE